MTDDHDIKQDWTEQLKPTTAGLLFPSETDAPVVPFVWETPEGHLEFTAESVVKLSGHPADTPVEEIGFDDLFAKVTQPRDWHNEVGRKRTEGFTALRDLLRENLRGIRVFRLGTISIDVIVVGVDPKDRLAGVTTKVVET
jgi:hypothetical protein